MQSIGRDMMLGHSARVAPRPTCPGCHVEADLVECEFIGNARWHIEHAKDCPNYPAALKRGLGANMGRAMAEQFGFTNLDAKPVPSTVEAKMKTAFYPMKKLGPEQMPSLAMRMFQRADKHGDDWLAPYERMGIVENTVNFHNVVTTEITVRTETWISAVMAYGEFYVYLVSKYKMVGMTRLTEEMQHLQEIIANG